MKTSIAGAEVRKIDKTLSITDLFDGKGFAFDFVIGELHGHHPRLVNQVSDRAYFVLEGTGTIHVGDESYAVCQGDLVTIKAQIPHGLEGDLKYVIVTSPPFDPANEKVV